MYNIQIYIYVYIYIYITKDNDENWGVEVVVGQKVEVLLGRYLYVRPDSDETQPNWKSNNSFVHRKGI